MIEDILLLFAIGELFQQSLFMFPIPLTIIVSRNKKLKTGAKIGVIAAAWIIYLLIGISANASKDNKQAASIKTHTSYTEMTSGGAK